jgi:hypothetical protein
MRYRFMATYRGIPYEAGVGPADSDIMLFAACPPPEELGFQPATGHWRKAVTRAEVDAIWESRPSGVFGGEPCLVLDDLGDQLHIGYPGHDPLQAERLGYCEVEPGVFEVLVNRDDVAGISEERVDRPYPGAVSWPETQVPPWIPAADPAWPPSGSGSGSGSAEPAWAGPLPGGPGWSNSGSAEPPRLGSGSIEPPWPGPGSAPGTPTWPASGSAPGGQAWRDSAAGEPAWSGAASAAGEPAPAYAAPTFAAPVAVAPVAAPAQTRRGHHGPDAGPSWARTRDTFTELANLAAITPGAYAIDEQLDGAICLIRTDKGFEVFTSVDGTRQETRLFADEEAAYFYLFGLLTAEAVRDGRLLPPR